MISHQQSSEKIINISIGKCYYHLLEYINVKFKPNCLKFTTLDFHIRFKLFVGKLMYNMYVHIFSELPSHKARRRS